MDLGQMKSVIEGLLFVAGDEGLDAKQLSEVLEQDAAFVRELILDLQSDLKRQGRGLQIVELAGTYQLATLPEHALYFERLAYSPSRSSLSQAALETLAIVAYRQPITRIDIEEIRGVKSDRALQTLVAKDLIHEVDRADAPGRPILYGTTKSFLDYFGLATIADLPETTMFENDDNLEEETRLLFEKLDGKQVTMDEIDDTDHA
ncbi:MULTISPECIES: SMC-Scp complex subunit ScpB [unclassified Paenibacillus]|uniref:SMC-Scp complex subunit ScpB n=1 Tax=unclassified Paenibacillus TaxID=185978 RepID=UPI001AE7F19E|nr:MULTISPECIES: SMC-Scp complex subunit ScpB [unclassified Paenibacillus]MBP1155197.1 segregation and condensation protein B [Paenibacillus sp. PvP091]MBP1169419.1 segregation and condensation protein B [Paenibacillus sp. PvR098]MBP2440447.1 segregation and condensation protein B [Paenibacillus sp. PvP052]